MRIIAAPVMQVQRLARPNRSVDGTSLPKSEPSEADRQFRGVTCTAVAKYALISGQPSQPATVPGTVRRTAVTSAGWSDQPTVAVLELLA